MDDGRYAVAGVTTSVVSLGINRVDFPRVWRVLGGVVPLLVIGCNSPVWYLDSGMGERLAKQENKPLLLYFKEWHSAHHRNMGLEVFSNPDVQKEMLDTINVELEFDWYRQYALKVDVHEPQFCVMCNPAGKMVGSPIKAKQPVTKVEDFLAWLKRNKALAVPPPTSGPAGGAKTSPPHPSKGPKDNKKTRGSAEQIQ